MNAACRAQLFMALIVFRSVISFGQSKNERSISDGGKKFWYTDSAAITPSYIKYFGDHFQVPDLQTIDGRGVTEADLRGKITVFNFWFISCKPCLAEIPALNRVADKYRSDSIRFIAITFDKAERVREFLQKRPFHFEMVSMEQPEIQKIKKVAFYPFTAILNREGKLSFAMFGRPTGEDPDEEIFQLLRRQIDKALTQ